MAKQSGIHQLKGKVRGMSYYRQKGVSDGLARSINQGLSKRVKEDAAYANTRLNAAEFGTAGAFAGACIRSISERQRTMLKDFATGNLAKLFKQLILQDTTNDWGLRYVQMTGNVVVVRDTINTYAKNDFNSHVGGVWDVEVTSSGSDFAWTPNAELQTGWGSALAAKGATGAFVQMFAYKAEQLVSGTSPYRAASTVALIAETDVAIGAAETITTPATLPAAFNPAASDEKYMDVLVVVRPYKEVNGEKYIMQELCTFLLTPFVNAVV